MTPATHAPATLTQIDALVETHWHGFLAAFEGIDPAATEGPGVTGRSPAKQAVGHVAFWGGSGRGITPARPWTKGAPRGEVDWQAGNDAHVPVIT